MTQMNAVQQRPASTVKVFTLSGQINDFSQALLEEVALLEGIAVMFKSRIENILDINTIAEPAPNSPKEGPPEHGCASIAQGIARLKVVRDELQQTVDML